MKPVNLPFSSHHALEIIHNLDTLSALMKSTYHRELKHYIYSECHCECQQTTSNNTEQKPFDDPLDF